MSRGRDLLGGHAPLLGEVERRRTRRREARSCLAGDAWRRCRAGRKVGTRRIGGVWR
jgi:hypothetical protein